MNRPEGQLVLLDTPGLHRAHNKLDEYMTQTVRHSVADVDGVFLLVEPVAKIGEPEQELIAPGSRPWARPRCWSLTRWTR